MINFNELKELIEEYFDCEVVCDKGVWRTYYGYGEEHFYCKLDGGSTLYFRHKNNMFLLVGFVSNNEAYCQEDVDEILTFNEEIKLVEERKEREEQ